MKIGLMTSREERYQVTLNTLTTGIIECGTLLIRERNGNTNGIGFKYSKEYLNHPKAFAIDPQILNLTDVPFQFNVNHNLPGFLDDYLPDRWGRKVITRAATLSKKKDFNANSIIDILSLVSKSNIGALSIDLENENTTFDLGIEFKQLLDAENAAQLIDDPTIKISKGDFEKPLSLTGINVTDCSTEPDQKTIDEFDVFDTDF